jgi:hypothetical protein
MWGSWDDPTCGLTWDKARPRAKSLSWQTQGRRVK